VQAFDCASTAHGSTSWPADSSGSRATAWPPITVSAGRAVGRVKLGIFPEVRFAPDSLLEESGFEPLVPPSESAQPRHRPDLADCYTVTRLALQGGPATYDVIGGILSGVRWIAKPPIEIKTRPPRGSGERGRPTLCRRGDHRFAASSWTVIS
jgi:hypothetical protein